MSQAEQVAGRPPCGNWHISSGDYSGLLGPRIASSGGIATAAADDIWFAGSAGLLSGERPLMLHWNGSRLQERLLDDLAAGDLVVYAATAISSDDVWAVGTGGERYAMEALAIHWDGGEWRRFPVPGVSGFVHELSSVAPAGSAGVWAVGRYQRYHNDPGGSQIVHWDGGAWSQVAVQLSNTVLAAVAALDGEHVWAAGHHWHEGTQLPLVLRRTAGDWTEMPMPRLEGTNHHLEAILPISNSDVWAVGSYRAGEQEQTLALHWDGSAWPAVRTPGLGSRGGTLRSLAARAPDDVWAAGDSGRGSEPQRQALVEHWDGKTWTVAAAPHLSDDERFTEVAVAGDDIWITGTYFASRNWHFLMARFDPHPCR